MQIFLQLAVCNSTLGRCKIGKYMCPSQFALNVSNICHKFTSLKSRIALQVARKIAPCDRALSNTLKGNGNKRYLLISNMPVRAFSFLAFQLLPT